jgi:hypothetical protein
LHRARSSDDDAGKEAPMDDLFRGTTALITGASSGLGEEFARQLAARGANLVLAARTAAKLETLARELAAAHGITATAVPADLGLTDGADRLYDELERRKLVIQLLVSNAGFGLEGAFWHLDAARQAEMIRLNCGSLMTLARRLLPALIERHAGGLIHVASTGSFQAVPGMAVYAATKAFVLSLTVALAQELRGSGVRVLALCPGPVPTGFQAVSGAHIPKGSQQKAVVTPEVVVRGTLRAYERGKAIFIPGKINRFGAFGTRFISRPAAARIAYAAIGRPSLASPAGKKAGG